MMIRPVDGLQQSEYLKEFRDIYKRLEKRLEPLLVNQDQWKRDKSYLWHEDRIVVPSDRVPALLKWTHESSGHVGADRTLRLFKQWFHTTWTDDQLRKTLQPIVDKCPCRSCKTGDIRDRGLNSFSVRNTSGLPFNAPYACTGMHRFSITILLPLISPITRNHTLTQPRGELLLGLTTLLTTHHVNAEGNTSAKQP